MFNVINKNVSNDKVHLNRMFSTEAEAISFAVTLYEFIAAGTSQSEYVIVRDGIGTVIARMVYHYKPTRHKDYPERKQTLFSENNNSNVMECPEWT
jgi:hypothetical protein